MTHSCATQFINVWHNSEAVLHILGFPPPLAMYICDMTHWYTSDMSHSCVTHSLLFRVVKQADYTWLTSLIHIRVARLILVSLYWLSIPHILAFRVAVPYLYMCDMTPPCMWHELSICVIRPIHLRVTWRIHVNVTNSIRVCKMASSCFVCNMSSFVLSPTWMRQVTHVNESRHTHE